MVFPAVQTIDSARKILDLTIEFAEYISPEMVSALKATKNSYRQNTEDSVPKDINKTLTRNIDEFVPENERKIQKKHLTKLLAAILPIHNQLDLSLEKARIPEYGNGLNKVLQEVHHALFEWNCFQGSKEKIKFSTKVKKNKDAKDTKKDKGNNGEKEIEQVASYIFIKASNTLDWLIKCSFGNEIKIRNSHHLYFGIGDPNHCLYLLQTDGKNIDAANSRKIIFNGSYAEVIPVNLKQNEETSEDRNADISSEKYDLSRDDFIQLNKGLLRDLMDYSQSTRNELLAAQKIFVVSTSQKVKSYSQLVKLWFQIFNFSESVFASEISLAQVDKTLFGVIVGSIISAFFVPVLVIIGNNFFDIRKLTPSHTDSNAIFLGILILTIICVITILPIGFYIVNSLVYLVSRFASGQGSYDNQTYLASIIFVPACSLMVISLLLGGIPVIGGLLSVVVFLIIIAYVILLLIRVVKVTHQIPSKKAAIVVGIPLIVVFLFLTSGITLFTVLLGLYSG